MEVQKRQSVDQSEISKRIETIENKILSGMKLLTDAHTYDFYFFRRSLKHSGSRYYQTNVARLDDIIEKMVQGAPKFDENGKRKYNKKAKPILSPEVNLSSERKEDQTGGYIIPEEIVNASNEMDIKAAFNDSLLHDLAQVNQSERKIGVDNCDAFSEAFKKVCAPPVMIELSSPATSIEIQKVARGYVLTVGSDIFISVNDLGELVEKLSSQLQIVTAGV